MKPGALGHHVLNSSDRRMVDALREALARAEEASFCVAFVKSAGLQLILHDLARLLARGGRLRLLTSTYLGQTEPQALRSLAAMPNASLRIQDGPRPLHAKVFLFTQRDGASTLWVGSSNLTRAGLSLNTEWNTRHNSPEALAEAHDLFHELWCRPDVRVVDDDFIEAYAQSRLALPPPLRGFDLDAPWPPTPAPPNETPTPHAAQREALIRLRELRAEGARRALVIAAPGVGKTLLAAFDAQQCKAASVLFLAHRKDIVEQAAAAFGRVFGTSRSQSVWMEGAAPGAGPFVFATVQTFVALRRQRDPRALQRFDHVVVDEFHHAAADGWLRVIGDLDAGFLLGLTATPERADGRDVLEICHWNIAYELRLPDAIRQGFLLPFHYFGIADDLVEYARIPWTRGVGFDKDALEHALMFEERVTEILRHADEKGFDGPKRVAVGFCAGVRHARYMRDELARRGRSAEALTGEDDLARRHTVYARLQDPRDPLEWLFVADVLNEGVDLPAINVVAFLRPTESLGLFVQQLGRGLRLTPECTVLTVLDFIGQHRNAFVSLRGLHDPNAAPTAASQTLRAVTGVEVVPPPGCELLLEDRTIEVLKQLRERTRSRIERARDAYEQLRAEFGRPPRPIDFWDRAEVPSFARVRDAFKSWRLCRVAMNDAAAWERAVTPDSPLDLLLRQAERNWQSQRVLPYAALWAAVDVRTPIEQALAAFYAQHPHWTVEPAGTVKASGLWALLANELPAACFKGDRWCDAIRDALQDNAVAEAVRERLLPTLAADYRTRHCGVLRTPAALRLHAAYTRSEIVHYFGVQHDPTRHNRGVLRLSGGHFVLIAKLDTSTALKAHQYDNRILDPTHVLWTSQNQQRRDNEAGRDIALHRERGHRLHLFVQPAANFPARYLGEVSVESIRGDGPMRVTLALAHPLPESVRAALEQRDSEDD